MTSECFDTDACAGTEYDFTLSAREDHVLFSDVAGERPMDEIEEVDTDDQRAFVSQIQSSSVGLVSLYLDGRAHYSIHSPDYAIRYSGTCEVSS